MKDNKKEIRKKYNCNSKQLESFILKIKQDGGRFITISACLQEDKEVNLQYFFEFIGNYVIVETSTKDLSINSIFNFFNDSDIIERQINSLFNVKFIGNPNLEFIF